jgi:hypothetical protein
MISYYHTKVARRILTTTQRVATTQPTIAYDTTGCQANPPYYQLPHNRSFVQPITNKSLYYHIIKYLNAITYSNTGTSTTDQSVILSLIDRLDLFT